MIKKKIKTIEDDLNVKFTFTSKNIEEITEKMAEGYVMKNYQNPWFSKQTGVRRTGLSFEMTYEESEEYFRCAFDVQYFAEHYCKIKRSDGSIGEIKLRPYQREILDLFENDRVILCASRQVGKCSTYLTTVDVDGKLMRLGDLYYSALSKIRNLTLIERFKIFLYTLL